MRLTDILKAQNIKVPLTATTKNDAIGELVTLLSDNQQITDPKSVLASVLERESTRTTGIATAWRSRTASARARPIW